MGNALRTSATNRKKLEKEEKLRSSSLTPLKIEEVDCDAAYFTPESGREILDDVPVPESVQSSNSETDGVPLFICEICVDSRPLNDSFDVKGCTHFYCTRCIVRYIASKLDDNITRIPCPVRTCKGEVEFEYSRPILPSDVFARWGNALCESAIVSRMRFYCPYEDCSALFVNEGGTDIKESKCPFCQRWFCVQCKAPWHTEFECAKFQKLMKRGKDALMTNLARKKKWRRCPYCRHFVERSSGCFYMQCRCGNAFCYNCGDRLSRKSHSCPRCKLAIPFY